jgi:hypothetical protein
MPVTTLSKERVAVMKSYLLNKVIAISSVLNKFNSFKYT